MLHNRAEAIKILNLSGQKRQPFFFFTDFEGLKCWISDRHENQVLWNIKGNSNNNLEIKRKSALYFKKFPKSITEFKKQFEKVVKEIQYGNSFLVNLTVKTPIKSNLTLEEIYSLSNAKYKVLFKNQFVVFSPETFIEIKGNYVFTHPMKGTIDASFPNAHEKILSDKKETAEHVTIVDLLRNDLSGFSDKVEVTRFRYIDEIKTHEKTLLQVSTEIRGELKPNWQSQLGDILFSLLPAGSISGAPKVKTLDIIKSTEDYERGFYTGICGYFDGINLDTGVMIRYIEKEGNDLYFKSGGGITSFSNLEAEYQEVIDKIYVPLY